MSLAPGEQRTLAEIENQIRRSDPRLAAMFGVLASGCILPVAGPAPTEERRRHDSGRLIILTLVGVALVIACIAMAVNSASHAATARAGSRSTVGAPSSIYSPRQ